MFGGGVLLFIQFCQKTRRINVWLVLQCSIRIRSDCIINWQVMSGLDAFVCSHVKLLWRLQVCLLCLSSFLTSYSGSCYNITCPVIIHWAISYKYLFILRRPGRCKSKKFRSWGRIFCSLSFWVNKYFAFVHKGITVITVSISLCLCACALDFLAAGLRLEFWIDRCNDAGRPTDRISGPQRALLLQIVSRNIYASKHAQLSLGANTSCQGKV